MRSKRHMKLGQFTIAALGSLLLLATVQAGTYKGSQYAGEAKLTIEEARAVAVKAYPGTVVEEELEHKKGGSGLRFSFDIRANHVTHEVAVDAKTGAVLENSRESNNDND